ncbi:copper resistance protein CopC [Streptomyces naganishii]|uniref:Protein YobA n=1 Tax=Streptomyces naganishii JCM 4654 TaxID=1306179 RepID=A0A918XZY4_9ACTN|nr:copper resistance protein CopC [Streptomyces naganishii]GHD84848.1 transport integral membrane protein [Streptomyces naganishii JCM 4654]
MTRPRPLWKRPALLGALLVLLVLGGAGPAAAHAAVRSTDPADGTVLKSAPHSVTLTFTESVGLLDDSFRLFDPEGRRVHTGEARHAPGRPDTARVAFPGRLGEGTFTVAWRVVSADSHPVSGAFTFSVGKPSPTAAAIDTGPAENPATAGLHDLARYAAYGGAALLIGAAAFVLICRPPDPGPLRRPLLAGWWTLLASTLALLALRAPYETGSGPAGALDPAALARTLSGRPGLALLARLLLLAPTAVLLPRLTRRGADDGSGKSGGGGGPARPSPRFLGAAVVLALALALTWAASDHASAGVQVPAAMTSSVLHLLAMAVWLGGLTALLTLLTALQRPAAAAREPAGETTPAGGADPARDAVETPAAKAPGTARFDVPGLTSAVARFSRVAFASVAVLVLTGVYQSWRGLGSWTALAETAYGRLLLVKLVAVALLLAAAGLSRRWTARLVATDAEAAVRGISRATTAARERVPQRAGGPSLPAAAEPAGPFAPDAQLRGLRRSVLTEVGVGVMVLVITTVLSGTLPGRAAAEAAQAAPSAGAPGAAVTVIPFDVGTPGGRGKVQITLEPGRVGQNAVEAVVFGPDGGLAAVPELRLSLSLPARGIGPIDARLADRGGYWGTDSLNLPMPGTWTMKATVRVSELDQVSESRTIEVSR